MKIKSRSNSKIELMMTPMIDIVFQLLIFFIMSFKIAVAEGDFNVKMPLAAPREGMPQDDTLPPMKVRLTASPGGQLSGITLNENRFNDFKGLHQYIIGVIGNERGPGSRQATAEVELDCDYNLRYENVVRAVTAVSGYVGPDGNIIKLVEKLKFAPPKQAN